MSNRLPNGLTPEQDAAFNRFAEAVAEHLKDDTCPGCMFHTDRGAR